MIKGKDVQRIMVPPTPIYRIIYFEKQSKHIECIYTVWRNADKKILYGKISAELNFFFPNPLGSELRKHICLTVAPQLVPH